MKRILTTVMLKTRKVCTYLQAQKANKTRQCTNVKVSHYYTNNTLRWKLAKLDAQKNSQKDKNTRKYTWGHPELLTFGETRNNRLNTFVPLYTLAPKYQPASLLRYQSWSSHVRKTACKRENKEQADKKWLDTHAQGCIPRKTVT